MALHSKEHHVTVKLPADLAKEIMQRHIPRRAASLEEYALSWIRFGTMIDRALAATSDSAELIAALKAAVLDTQRREE